MAFAALLDRVFWRLPLPFHYAWGAVVVLFEALSGATNPRTFENIRQLRAERLERHARRRSG